MPLLLLLLLLLPPPLPPPRRGRDRSGDRGPVKRDGYRAAEDGVDGEDDEVEAALGGAAADSDSSTSSARASASAARASASASASSASDSSSSSSFCCSSPSSFLFFLPSRARLVRGDWRAGRPRPLRGPRVRSGGGPLAAGPADHFYGAGEREVTGRDLLADGAHALRDRRGRGADFGEVFGGGGGGGRRRAVLDRVRGGRGRGALICDCNTERRNERRKRKVNSQGVSGRGRERRGGRGKRREREKAERKRERGRQKCRESQNTKIAFFSLSPIDPLLLFKMQALASRGVRVAPLRAPSQQQQQQRARAIAATAATRSTATVASFRSNAVATALVPARRRPTPNRAGAVVAVAAAASPNAPLVTGDEGPISEEAFSVR